MFPVCLAYQYAVVFNFLFDFYIGHLLGKRFESNAFSSCDKLANLLEPCKLSLLEQL
jgi:hypothetical protein